MEAEPTDSTSCPRWVLLNRYSYPRDSGVADAKTTSAATFTSTGRRFAVSLCLKAPPASSSFFYDWFDGREDCMEEPQVIAVHGDCLLIEMVAPGDRHNNSSATLDYFLYDAGAARRLPSLSLLPACFYPMDFERGMTRHYPQARVMRKEDTGILRRGDDELLLVAQLEVTADGAAELCVLRLGRSEWELNRAVPIVHGEETGSIADGPMRRWQADAVVPVGDRFLCWVDYFRGILLGDMAADVANLRLEYVALPVEPGHGWQWPSFDGSRPDPRWSMNLAAAGAATLRFVSVEPRRSGSGDTTCACGRMAFTVTTWTLRLMMEEPAAMTWVKDSVLDCGELWAFPGYEGVPRVTVKYPIVSSDDADVVCFMVTEDDYVYREGTRIWMVEVDTRSKALRSVVCYMSDRWGEGYYVAAKLQC